MYKNFGIVLVCLSVFLYSVRYIVAAIYASNTETWSKELFASMLEYVGSGPLRFSWITLVVGLFFVFFSDFKKRVLHEFKKIRENLKKDIEDTWGDGGNNQQ